MHEFEWTTTNMSPSGHVPKRVLFWTFILVLYWGWKVPSKKIKIKLFHLHHITMSISTKLLQNTTRFGSVPVCKKKLKNVDVEFQVGVRYWASTNHLQNYKMYGTMIKMFIPMFLSTLPQPLKGNPWLVDSTHQNFKTRIFHRQCDYMLGFQLSKKKPQS
jgi:hypothetical protein